MNSFSEVRCPIRVYFLLLLVLVVAAWNGLRLGEALYFWKTLNEYGAHPLYISMSGGIWLIIGLVLAWSLWRGKTWGWLSTILATAGYSCWYWFDQLVLQEPHTNWPFVLTTNIILVLIILFILFSRKTRRFFMRHTHEY